MDYQSLHMKTVVELKKLAKLMGVRVPAGTNKDALVERLLEADAASSAKEPPKAKPEPASEVHAEKSAPAPDAPTEKPAPRRRGRPPKAKPEAAGNPENKAPKPARGARAKKAESGPAKPVAPEAESAAPVRPEPKEAKEVEAPKSAAPEAPGTAGNRVVDSSEGQPAQAATEAAPEAQQAAQTRRPMGTPSNVLHRTASEQQASAPATSERRTFLRQPAARAAQESTPQRRPAPGYVNRGFVRAANGGDRVPQAAGEGANRPVQRAVNPRFAPQRQPARFPSTEAVEAAKSQEPQESTSLRERREPLNEAERRGPIPAAAEPTISAEEADGAGVLEIQPDGYGFLRAENCLPGPNDIYISIAQIRRFNLRMGDYVVGKTRPQREGDRYSAMLYIHSVNGEPPENAASRPRFEDLVPIYPDERFRLESPTPQGKGDFSLRLVDMLAPIGKGQRGMIVSQPKAGKTTLLKKIANAITAGYPDIQLIVLLIDERPEEVTDMKRSIDGEVVYSTFDEAPENHVRVSEMVLERAQRLVEMGKDVVVLMDSITRLARAYNLVITPTGRSLSGGLDPGALFKPKRFFGAARNIENGGSLTVIATALVETGSRMDDIIFEEFKGTGNMELHLDRKLSDKRVFPAIDMLRSGTRREELLLTEAELDGEMLVRRVLSGGRSQEMAEQIIELMSKTATNAEFFERLKGWIGVFEKEGFTLGGK